MSSALWIAAFKTITAGLKLLSAVRALGPMPTDDPAVNKAYQAYNQAHLDSHIAFEKDLDRELAIREAKE